MRPFPKIQSRGLLALFLGFFAIRAAGATYYVDINSANPTPPFSSWATASTDIQSAINLASSGDLILVNDGVYQTGGETVNGFGLTNRVAVTVPVTVESVNGPGTTLIEGYQDPNSGVADDAIRCVYLTNNAVLSGFTLTNGATLADGDITNEQSGGGIYCESTNVLITNCVATFNLANYEGGGTYGGTLVNCTLLNNVSFNSGGGAAQGILNGCMINGNNANVNGGGVIAGTLFNCLLTNNYAASGYPDFYGGGGGAEGSTLEQCTITGNSADNFGGGAESSVLNQCNLVGNQIGGSLQTDFRSPPSGPIPLFIVSPAGGGAESCTLNNCFLEGNQGSSWSGGGADSSALTNCVLANNGAGQGGGVSSSMLVDCVLTNNVAGSGAGAESSTLTDCVLAFNSSQNNGGGADSSTLVNSAVYQNTAVTGGGASYGTLVNCTVVANSAASAGGATFSALTNCIVYFNSVSNAPGPANYDSGCTLAWCDTTPLPASGINNIAGNPELADFEHITAGSPCIGAGDFAATSGVDIDGQPWLDPPSIGCDEFYTGTVTGPLSVSAQADYTNVVAGFTARFSSSVMGNASYNVWNFGDGIFVTNNLVISHSWNAAGNYAVTFTAYNNDNLGGVSAVVMVSVTAQEIYYVNANGTNPIPPYSTWTTAATNIQDAVGASFSGGTVLVTNGIYQYGGETENGFYLTNRVIIPGTITVQSVNGPAVTIIEGYQDPNTVEADDAVRCAYVMNHAVLSGFTLANGATRAGGDGIQEQSGGGALCESDTAVLSNCVVSAGAATYSGGGVYQGTLENCVIYSNQVTYYGNGEGGGADSAVLVGCVLLNNFSYVGGGAENSTLLNCSLSGNYTYIDDDYTANGGGVANSQLTNCVLSGNSCLTGGGASSSTLVNCLLTGNFTEVGDGVWPPTGGGASGSTLINCTVIYNTANNTGGGVCSCSLTNCIVYFNNAPNGTNYSDDSTLSYCDADPLVTSGQNNIDADPLFVNTLAGDYHLQSNSPCINSGNNAYVTGVTDLDGNPRIVGGTVDIGAYEYQTPTSVISYAWLQQYGLPTDGSVDYTNLDGTAFNLYQDWVAGLNPTNSASVLAMLTPAAINNANGITVTWQSVAGITYFLQRSSDLQVFTTIQSSISGQAGTTSYTDTCATNNIPYFYRVGVTAP